MYPSIETVLVCLRLFGLANQASEHPLSQLFNVCFTILFKPYFFTLKCIEISSTIIFTIYTILASQLFLLNSPFDAELCQGFFQCLYHQMEVLFTRRSFFYKMHVNSKRIRLTLLCARTDNEMKLLKKKEETITIRKMS